MGAKSEKDLPDLVVTRNGVPFKDQAEGLRQFKAACLAQPGEPVAPDISPAGRYAMARDLAVTDEWKRGFNAAWDHLRGGSVSDTKGEPSA